MAGEIRTRLKIGPQGRIVVPAAIRSRLGVDSGDVLIASVDDGRLVLETEDAVVARLRKLFEHIPPEVSLVDELIAERRQEAARENAGE